MPLKRGMVYQPTTSKDKSFNCLNTNTVEKLSLRR